MAVKTDCDQGCRIVGLPSSPAAPFPGSAHAISASVGAGGVNRSEDVRTVQGLLNRVPAARGGAAPPLEVDGLCGPLTRAAILRFQSMRVPQAADGRIDPGGPTWTALRAEASPVTASSDTTDASVARKAREAARLANAIAAIPATLEAVRRARRTVDAALDYATLGGGFALSAEPFEFTSMHFDMKGLSALQTGTALRFLQVVYSRMDTVLRGRIGITGTEIFGRNLHDIDPFPGRLPAQAKAFVPREDRDGLKTTRIYWCDGIDGHPLDRYVHLTLHELAHFVDEDDPALAIVDHGYAFDGKVLQLNHQKRLHNADNYAMFAFDRAFGRERLVAMYPHLAAMK